MARPSAGQPNSMAMMAFALVEVVKIVVGIVMANQLEEQKELREVTESAEVCLLYTSPSPRDKRQSRMPSSA